MNSFNSQPRHNTMHRPSGSRNSGNVAAGSKRTTDSGKPPQTKHVATSRTSKWLKTLNVSHLNVLTSPSRAVQERSSNI